MSDDFDLDPEEAAVEALKSATFGANGADKNSEPLSEIDEEIERLLKLPRLDYQRARKDAAKRLGLSVAALDAEIRERRKQNEEDDGALPHWLVEPWEEQVDTADLLDAIVKLFGRYIFLPKNADEAIAVWVLHAWTFDVGDISPFLIIKSPTKRCGKTSVLILLYWLTPRSELASNISPTAIFRYIERERPTMLFDEAETFIKSSDEARGILNSGHTRTAAHSIRNVETNGEHIPQRFSTWAPKALAYIGELAGTLEDRGIIVPMQRKPKGAKVTRLRRHDCEEYAILRRKALRWANDSAEALKTATPRLPEALNDRAVDNWEPLLAIAELAGKEWTNRVLTAALTLSGDDAEADDGYGVELLHDIRAVFTDDEQMIFTKTLVSRLVTDEERPWATFNSRTGKPITDRQVAALLKPFRIISTNVWAHGAQAKGYRKTDFAEAWDRYPTMTKTHGSETKNTPEDAEKLSWPPEGQKQPSERTSPTAAGTSSVFSSVQNDPVDAHETAKLFNNGGPLDGRTDDFGGGRGKRKNRAKEPCAQCGADDEPMHTKYGVPLHALCVRFYLNEHPDVILQEDDNAAPF